MTIPSSVGRYRVTAELGRGAMGVVYRGTDPALDRTVAIKVIRAGVADSSVPPEEVEARFLREAKVAARINHPNVVTIFDAGREGHALFMVMELVDGESLAARIARGAFPTTAEALEFVARVAEALAAAHAMGVVHRDIKPANIMLTRESGVKVTDFGVAKAIGEGTDLTRTGTVVGSPAYMAPEQVRGEKVDGRSDLFSLGVVLYELLMRRKPFPAETVTTLIYQILNDDPFRDAASTSSLGPELTGFLRSCLAKDPSQRIADGTAFATQARGLIAALAPPVVEATGPTRILTTPVAEASRLAAAAATAPVQAPKPAAPAAAGAKPARRLPVMPLVVLGIGLLLIVIVALFLGRSKPLQPAGEVLGGGSEAPSATPLPGGEAALAVTTPGPTAAPYLEAATPVPGTVSTPPPDVTPGALLADLSQPTPIELTVEPTAPPHVVATFKCSKGAEFNVSPEDAKVTIDGHTIGKADDWDGVGGGKTYEFSGPGTYYVKLTLKGYKTTWVKIIVDPDAGDEIADVDTSLEEGS